MIPGLENPKEFIGGCFNLTTRCEAPCGEGEACCPTKSSEGVCQWECKATVDPKPKAGQCPAAPAPGVPGGETDADLDVDAALGFDEDDDASSGADEFVPQRRPMRPRGPMKGRWIRGFCRFAVMNGKADPIQCRHDGDCAGSQKCCSPKPNPDNFLEMCKRQCIDV